MNLIKHKIHKSRNFKSQKVPFVQRYKAIWDFDPQRIPLI